KNTREEMRGEKRFREGLGRPSGTRRDGRVAAFRRIMVGSWSVGSITGKLLELVDALERRKVDIACFQETKWKGAGNREANGYKLWYSGSLTARNGVGVILKAGRKGVPDEPTTDPRRRFKWAYRSSDRGIRRVGVVAPKLIICWCEEDTSRRVKTGGSALPRILWKNLTGNATEAFRSRVAKGISTRVEALAACDADTMWNTLASIIKDVTKDTLGVAIRTSKTHTARRESWWLCEEVQLIVAVKQDRFRELLSCREGNEEERLGALESQAEVRTTLQKMGRNKAVGQDQIPIEAWKSLGDEGSFWLSILFNKIFTSMRMPEEWRLSEVIPIFKNKGDAQVCSNYRGIKLLGHTMELWERVIERRLRRETLVSENQFGFMPGRSLVEAIHLIRSLMEKYRERQRDLHMAFLDLEKAYNSVPRELIWKTLVDKGTSRRYIRVIRDMHDGAKTRVQTSIGYTEFFPVDVGLHQGSAISPYLFALILDELSRGIQEDIPWCLIFANDIVLVSESAEGLNIRLEN
ncbi:retrovirus-related pol polyprotein LINE-1, partial [Tanacetum coccineum]